MAAIDEQIIPVTVTLSVGARDGAPAEDPPLGPDEILTPVRIGLEVTDALRDWLVSHGLDLADLARAFDGDGRDETPGASPSPRPPRQPRTAPGPSRPSGSEAGHSAALDAMLAQDWGAAAAVAARAVGVNPSATAATAVVENLRNANSSHGAQGVFQMQPLAFEEGLRTALAADPGLRSEIVSGDGGRHDPLTESIAADGYLVQADRSLRAAGIAQPTVLDGRAYYNFGPATGARIAEAGAQTPMSKFLTASDMRSNAIGPNETVGGWRARMAAKLGDAAEQPIAAGARSGG